MRMRIGMGCAIACWIGLYSRLAAGRTRPSALSTWQRFSRCWRSRGMGKVNLHLNEQPLDKQDRFDHFKQRVAAFDKKLQEQVESAFGSFDRKPLYFALTLHSPVIAYDDLLHYRGAISEEMLGE